MTLSFLISTAAQLLILAIIVRALLSWFPGTAALAPVSVFVSDITDPILRPIQRRLRPVGGLDLTPIVAIVLISIAEGILLSVLGGH